MVTRTHCFYLDEKLTQPVEIGAEGEDDRLVFSNGMFCIIRHDQRLYCTTPTEKEGKTTFVMDNAHPIHAAMDLAEMYKIGTRIVHGDARVHTDQAGEYEWKLEKRQ